MNEQLFDKLTPTRLPEQIAARIESLILGSQLHPGDKLPPERELGAQFGVSRAVVRESIKLLEERGLVEPRNGRGAFVTTPGLGNLTSSLNVAFRMQDCTFEQLHEARWCLESIVARLAAERATEADLARIKVAIQTMDTNLDFPSRFIPADLEFHAALASATHNPLFSVMTRPLVDMIQTVAPIAFSYGHVLERHRNHQRILECITQRDASGAVEAMQQHLNLSRQALQDADARKD